MSGQRECGAQTAENCDVCRSLHIAESKQRTILMSNIDREQYDVKSEPYCRPVSDEVKPYAAAYGEQKKLGLITILRGGRYEPHSGPCFGSSQL
jgi:hypothetical protein